VLAAADQPIEARTTGLTGLSSLFNSQGRVRESLRMMEEEIRSCLAARDTDEAISAIIRRSFIKFGFLKDVRSSGTEIELAARLGAASRPQTVINFAAWYAIQGDSRIVDSLVKNPRVVNMVLHSIASSRMHDCARAEAYYDTAARANIFPDAGLLCLFDLATCRYESGSVDDALGTMRQLLAMNAASRSDDNARYQLLMGKLYEKKGDKKLAMEHYERFFNMWKNADRDLPDLIDAKARLAKLKGNA
jgi:tetratricopeptide (TPR) repeat protein